MRGTDSKPNAVCKSLMTKEIFVCDLCGRVTPVPWRHSVQMIARG